MAVDGFIPQKEIVYNGLLPYSDRLDREATELLAEIKANLSRAVLLRELWPGSLSGPGNSSRKFLKLYGRRFSKEDHILFIKLLYELVTLPNLEPHMMQIYARLLIHLLKSVTFSCDCKIFSKTHLVNLFARLANDNIGYVDWTPYIPTIFTRILRSLNLPVGVSQMVAPRYLTNSYDIGHLVLWITALLGGPGNPAQKELTCLFNSIASFYHPSNHGRWQSRLMRLLQRLPASVVRRVHRERHAAPSWITVVPECQRLTDADLQEFTRSLIGAALLAMFSKTGSTDAAYALQNLALLTPELAIPPVLEKTYAAMETLTEPHTLTATLSCMIGMARSLVSPNNHYPEGRAHVLPLLMGSLPGVDPNDFSKCMITFQFIATFTTLVPLVDCSSAPSRHSDLTEVEKDLCFASAEFEDFVLQFLDRCFALIDSSTLEQTRDEMETDTQTHLESLVELGLSSTVSTILTQCSTEIYKVALQKVYNFATSNIFETCVSGRMVADMCRAAAKELQSEDELDKELLWNLQLLSEVTRVDGEQLLKYQGDLEQILCVCVRLRCKRAYTLACNLLEHTLRSLSLIYPTEYRSTPGGFDSDLPILDWGRAGDVAALGVCWHVPSTEEENFVFQLLSRLLHPELERIKSHVSGDQPMSREELLQSLAIVQHCLLGAGSMLPPLDGPHIISDLMFFRGTHKKEFDSRWKSFTLVKKSMENRMRKLVVEGSEYKVVHRELLCDLLLLSTSTYSQGALYCLLGVHTGVCLASVRDWDCVGDVWPALVRCGLSPSMTLEKPSIGRLLDDVVDRIHRQHDTIGIYFTVSEGCVEIANQISQSENPMPCLEVPTTEELKEGLQRQRIKNVVAARKYEKLVNDLLDCLEDRDLPWKFEHMATDLLSLLLRDDHPLPPDAVLFFTQSLIHDSISIRKVAISAMAGILKQLKRPRKKVAVKPTDISGIEEPEGLCVGDREGNRWLQYDSNNLPLSEEQWETQHYVEKTHWGYYTWPREMMIYAAYEKPKDDLPYEEMSEGEKIIFEYFSDPEFIDQLIEFLSLEDRKGKDSFNPRRFCLFKEGRDPRKLHWLFELLMESPLSGEGGSFRDASLLYVLQGGLAQQQWRVSELLHRLLAYLEPKLTQVYKNVRERIGSVLTYIFMIDVALPHTQPTSSPHVAEFVTRVLERLKPLTSEPEIHNHVHEENTQETDERTQAVKLLKTGQNGMIAPVEIDESYDEMKQDARTCLSLMSQGLLYPEHIPLVLAALEEMAGSRSWHARFSVLTYLQIMVFYNLFTLLSLPAQVSRIRTLVMQLLLDEQLEVRDMAGTTLSGLLQCQFFPLDSSLQTQLQTLSQTCLPKARGELASTGHDMTVKKTLSEFRRTHHDNWQEHRQCFTDDQLLVLTDLLVSPCYYA
ncbi:hypothetical protein INR49_005689 [Caranx melampygus]|nr:hypothetical protein INR49_005689 [Caranx melampygus]